MSKQDTLFESSRMTMEEAKALTIETMNTYLERYDHLAFAFSGGKDSSATVTLIAHLIAVGAIKQPKSMIVFYADTRLELTPLQMSAMAILNKLSEQGIKTQVVMPPMDDRFFVYILGRGVPPPSNTFRWCTSQLKIEPMQRALEDHAVNLGMGEMTKRERDGKGVYRGFGENKLLMVTGVRLGESAHRDDRIVLSCRDGAECGQGWLQKSAKEGLNDTLAPLLHWRVCHVWDWLNIFQSEHGYPTRMIAEAYGGDEAAEINARTGCVGCNLASRDLALETILAKYPEKWGHLSPLLKLRPMYAEMKKPENRLRKWGEKRLDGSLAANQGRLGPLTLEARRRFLKEVLAIQRELLPKERWKWAHVPLVELISWEEYLRIEKLIEAETWPNGWEGTEMRGDQATDTMFRDGTVQPWLLRE